MTEECSMGDVTQVKTASGANAYEYVYAMLKRTPDTKVTKRDSQYKGTRIPKRHTSYISKDKDLIKAASRACTRQGSITSCFVRAASRFADSAIRSAIRRTDKNGDGVLDYPELSAAVTMARNGFKHSFETFARSVLSKYAEL
jgi:hypothetical protein